MGGHEPTSQHTFRDGLGWEEGCRRPRGPGGAAARSGPPVPPWSLAGGGRAPAGGVTLGREYLALRLAGVGRQRPPKGGDDRPPGPADGDRTAPSGEGLAEGRPRPRLQHRPVDAGSGGQGDRQGHWGGVPPRPRLEAPALVRVELAEAGSPNHRARRGGGPALDARGVAADKKSVCRKRAWIVFEDESGASLTPVVRRTWAPRGQTPVLRHPFNWKRISMAAALAYRWDGKRARLSRPAPAPTTTRA